jgi:hypothetical protein
MRINRRSLLRVIRNTVLERTHTNPNLVSIYLGGSVLGSDYALGGTVDIDLFFIHAGPVEQEREIVRLTDEVHLDIAHHDQKAYRHPKELRLHPWMGHTIKDGEIFYDPSHFMDFTQASVRGQFARPDNVLIRVRKQGSSRLPAGAVERQQRNRLPDGFAFDGTTLSAAVPAPGRCCRTQRALCRVHGLDWRTECRTGRN